MSLNIKNEETQRLARELAQLTGETMAGETMTGATLVAPRERLEREHRERSVEERRRALLEIRKRIAKLPMRPGPVRSRARRPPLRRARPACVIVDSSAVLAILLDEPDAELCDEAMLGRIVGHVSTPRKSS